MNHSMISELSRSLLEIVWHFGPKGLNGECCDNLTMPEFIALDKVSSTKDCPVQDIGISLGFTKSGATRVVNRLEKKGYVKKIKSHYDARFCCVDITEKGELVLKSTDSRYLEKIHELVAKMPPQIATEVVSVLLTMAKSLKG